MKIEKAIEIKMLHIVSLPPGVDEDWITADKLSIEALKFTLAVRGTIISYATLPLPGETKE